GEADGDAVRPRVTQWEVDRRCRRVVGDRRAKRGVARGVLADNGEVARDCRGVGRDAPTTSDVELLHRVRLDWSGEAVGRPAVEQTNGRDRVIGGASDVLDEVAGDV